MPSTWIARRARKTGGTSYRVMFRTGGRESARYAGAFATMREAKIRRDWAAGELAAMRVPDLTVLAAPVTVPTLREVAEQWKASRVDVTEGTRVLHRVALDRVLPLLGDRPVDEFAGVDPNPARDRRVRLPYEEHVDMNPPTAVHVEAVYRTLLPAYRLALLWLDWSGARVASIDTLTVGDYDERDRRVRLRASTTKTRQALWVDLPDALADALEASLPARDDRDEVSLA